VLEHPDSTVIEAVLGHELAHVARLDSFWLALQRTLEAIYFFHPVVWVSGTRLHRERERICDLSALERGNISPTRYASSLVEVLGMRLGGVLAPTMAPKNRRTHMRIQNILESEPSRTGRVSALVATALLGVFLTPLCTSTSGRKTHV
jgi:beta-lactamase regulating signal transducer with metallopeptidase domain